MARKGDRPSHTEPGRSELATTPNQDSPDIALQTAIVLVRLVVSIANHVAARGYDALCELEAMTDA